MTDAAYYIGMIWGICIGLSFWWLTWSFRAEEKRRRSWCDGFDKGFACGREFPRTPIHHELHELSERN